jgi:hypothetical protein
MFPGLAPSTGYGVDLDRRGQDEARDGDRRAGRQVRAKGRPGDAGPLELRQHGLELLVATLQVLREVMVAPHPVVAVAVVVVPVRHVEEAAGDGRAGPSLGA